MSAADLLGQVDEVSLWSVSLSRILLSPQVEANTTSGTKDSGDACPVGMSLVWSHNSGAPWGRGMNPRREDVAKRLARCDKMEFRPVVLFSRFHFLVTLKDGRVQDVSPVEGEFE